MNPFIGFHDNYLQSIPGTNQPDPYNYHFRWRRVTAKHNMTKRFYTLIAGRKIHHDPVECSVITSCEFAILQHRKQRQSNCITINNILATIYALMMMMMMMMMLMITMTTTMMTTMTPTITMMLVQNIKHPAWKTCTASFTRTNILNSQQPKSSWNHQVLPSDLSIFHPMT